MQVSEFKAWFAGFTEAVAKLPTEEQWARIKARVDELDGTETVVQPRPVDRNSDAGFLDTQARPNAGAANLTRWPSSGEAFTAPDEAAPS